MATIKIKNGLDVNRTSVTPTTGEMLWTRDTHKLYVGDGVTAGGIIVNPDVTAGEPAFAATSAKYESTYTTVNSNSASWGGGVQIIKQIVSVQVAGNGGGGSGIIPNDATIPQNTEGVEWSGMALTITPTLSSSTLHFDGRIHVSTSTYTTQYAGCVAIFVDNNANAICSNYFWVANTTTQNFNLYNVPIHFRYSPGDTNQHTFKIRAGSNNNGSVYFNQDSSGTAKYGTSLISYLRCTEI